MRKYREANRQIIYYKHKHKQTDNITVIALKSSDNILGFSPKNDRKEESNLNMSFGNIYSKFPYVYEYIYRER